MTIGAMGKKFGKTTTADMQKGGKNDQHTGNKLAEGLRTTS